MSERDRGERDIMETEKRLATFAERVTGRGLSDSRQLKLRESRNALEKFLELNVLILNLKKVALILLHFRIPLKFSLFFLRISSNSQMPKQRGRFLRSTPNEPPYRFPFLHGKSHRPVCHLNLN